MQQMSLFETNPIKKIKKWNIKFETSLFDEDMYISVLEIPSWKFIVKYSILNNKIETFEILDIVWYVWGISLSIIKNIRCLINTIIKRKYIV